MSTPGGTKRILELLASPEALWHASRFRWEARFMGADRAFELASEQVAGIAGLRGLFVRRAYYRRVLERCGADCTFCFGVVLTKTSVGFGRNVSLGIRTLISSAQFGDDVVVGPHVCFLSGRRQHGTARRDIPMTHQSGETRTLRIGSDCWFGAGAVITDDVGDGAIVAAGAVVVEPVPAYAIVAGSPARIIGMRP